MSDNFSDIKGGDFNGDGMLDFLLYDGSSGFTLHLNDGCFGFTECQVSNLTLIEDDCDGVRGNDFNDDKDDFIITDFNQDGKSDLIIIDINCVKECSWYLGSICMNPYTAYVNTTIKWYESEGSSFTLSKSLTLQDQNYYYKGYSTSGDFNGDGREDLFSYGSNLYSGNSTSENGYVYSSFNTNFEANQIKSISKSLGDKIFIHYQPLTFTQHDGQNYYVKGTSSTYPIADIQIPYYCVSNVLDTTRTINKSYSYAGIQVHLQGKGFLGFSEQTVQDRRNNTKTVFINEMNYDYCLPTKQTKKTIMSNNVLVAKTETEYENSVSEGTVQNFV